MQFLPIKTRALLPPKDNIYPVLDQYLPRLHDGDILVITSKVLGIHQGRTKKIIEDTKTEQDRYIIKEAERYIPRKLVPGEYSFLTIKYNTLISSAGIDKSNANGYYVFWPKNPQKLATEIWQYLKRKHKIKKLGIIITDSHSVPLRAGTLGISIGFWGFEPVIDYRGKPDIFGRKLKVTRANIVDSLSAISVLLMGESRQQTPLLLIRGAKFIKFTRKDTYRKLIISPKIDMYAPLLKIFRKNK